MLKCIYCNGQLVWDYEHGEIVCSSCGVVYDRLTTLEAWIYRVNQSSSTVNEVQTKRRISKPVVSRMYRNMLRLYRKAFRIVEKKPWLEIDYEKVVETGRFVYTVKSRASINAVKNIEEKKYWSLIEKGLEYINNLNPAYLARSLRSKYALAYMVAVKLQTGMYPGKEEVTSVFNISDTSYRRLYLLAEKIINQKTSH